MRSLDHPSLRDFIGYFVPPESILLLAPWALAAQQLGAAQGAELPRLAWLQVLFRFQGLGFRF